jgi:hypothetical protein
MVVSRAAWLATVLSYQRTPYHHQGREPGVGMDCPAPLICGAWDTGLKPRSFDVKGYARDPDGWELKRLCDAHLEPIAYADALPGDVLLTAWARERMKPRHLGILTLRGERTYWLQAEGYRHKTVRVCRLVFGVDGMHLV